MTLPYSLTLKIFEYIIVNTVVNDNSIFPFPIFISFISLSRLTPLDNNTDTILNKVIRAGILFSGRNSEGKLNILC